MPVQGGVALIARQIGREARSRVAGGEVRPRGELAPASLALARDERVGRDLTWRPQVWYMGSVALSRFRCGHAGRATASLGVRGRQLRVAQKTMRAARLLFGGKP